MTYPQLDNHPLRLVAEDPTILIRLIRSRNVLVPRVCQLLLSSIVNLAREMHPA